MGLRIGELARRTGVGVSTLRAWESRFHFLEPERSSAGHRLYLETDVDRVDAVLRLVSEGLTLSAAIARVSSVGVGAQPVGEGEALLYGQILQVAGEGIWVSREGRTRYVNRRMADLMRCSVDDLLSTPVLEFLGPEDLQPTKERGEMVKGGKRLQFTQVLRRADGTTFLAQIDTAPLINQSGQYEGAVALVRDIEAQTQEETRARFRSALLDSIGEAVAAADPDGKLIYVNAAAERLFGWRSVDVLGKDGRALMASQDVIEEADRVHFKLLAGKRFSGNLKLARLDRSEFVGHLKAAPAFDADGHLIGITAVISDQSEQIQLQLERQALDIQLETLAMLGVQALHQQGSSRTVGDRITIEVLDTLRRVLDADLVTVIDVVPHTNELQVRAMSPRSHDPTVLPSGSRSFAGYVALARRVVVVDNAHRDRRFEMTQTRAGFHTASAIGAPIFGPGSITGVIAAESSTPYRFDHSAGHFVQGIANVIGMIFKDQAAGIGSGEESD
jgi:PAS domain S-box-containing protein